jgi:hypothetical protein
LKKAIESAAALKPVHNSSGAPHSFRSNRNGVEYAVSVAIKTNFQSEMSTPNRATGK